jgi:hypothetical protein
LREEIGQLEGRAYKDASVTVWVQDPTEDRAKVEWTVKAPRGGVLEIGARHERAGTVRKQLPLGNSYRQHNKSC